MAVGKVTWTGPLKPWNASTLSAPFLRCWSLGADHVSDCVAMKLVGDRGLGLRGYDSDLLHVTKHASPVPIQILLALL